MIVVLGGQRLRRSLRKPNKPPIVPSRIVEGSGTGRTSAKVVATLTLSTVSVPISTGPEVLDCRREILEYPPAMVRTLVSVAETLGPLSSRGLLPSETQSVEVDEPM